MLAFTFPGQGSQRPEMGAPWQDSPAWARVEEATQATGKDVAHLLLNANADELTETQNAQLATFVVSMMAYDAVVASGIAQARVMAGHSLGEYSALVAANIISFADGCRLVGIRGEAMKKAAQENPGTMYAVLGLDDIKVEAACRQATSEVETGGAFVANFNSAGQVVISGALNALERAAQIAKEMGAKRSVPLPVGGAFHTPHMAPALDELRKALAETQFNESDVQVVSNFDAAAHSGGEIWRELCAAQLCNPVRWSQSVQTITNMGASLLVELGPGNVLTNLAKRNAPNSTAVSVQTPDVDELHKVQATANSAKFDNDDAEEISIIGEQPAITDRVVVATSTGKFTTARKSAGQNVATGESIALIDGSELQSPFAGVLSRFLLMEGERVTPGQPIAWIATEQISINDGAN